VFRRADLFKKQEENGRKEAAPRKNLEQHGIAKSKETKVEEVYYVCCHILSQRFKTLGVSGVAVPGR